MSSGLRSWNAEDCQKELICHKYICHSSLENQSYFSFLSVLMLPRVPGERGAWSSPHSTEIPCVLTWWGLTTLGGSSFLWDDLRKGRSSHLLPLIQTLWINFQAVFDSPSPPPKKKLFWAIFCVFCKRSCTWEYGNHQRDNHFCRSIDLSTSWNSRKAGSHFLMFVSSPILLCPW